MSLAIPQYLIVSNVQDPSIRFEWDDWKHLPAKDVIDRDLSVRLETISQRAILAMMCGTAEWIVYRFGRLSNDPTLWRYMEGAWAMTIDVRYCGYGSGHWWGENSTKKWDGPIERPIADAIVRLQTAIQQLYWEGTDPGRRAGLIATLARYVMTEPAPYNRWLDQVIRRFESLYPRTIEDQLGEVVPRQAIDPDFDFRVEQTEVLVNEFLASLDYRSNDFLSSPEGMLDRSDEDEEDAVFHGIPYVFTIEGDRRARGVPVDENDSQ